MIVASFVVLSPMRMEADSQLLPKPVVEIPLFGLRKQNYWNVD